MKSINFKIKAKFGKTAILVVKLNYCILEVKGRRGPTNGKWSDYELRKMSFRNYGNPLQVSNCSPKGSTKDIINQGVKNHRGEKIMIFQIHESHNNSAWESLVYAITTIFLY